MKGFVNRREFVSALVALPFAAKSALAAQSEKSASIPIIDTHIHLFDSTRPEGSAWPRVTSPEGGPAQGKVPFVSALPQRYREVVRPFGVVGAIVIEATTPARGVEDTQWVLDQAAANAIIVGTVGRLDPGDPDFGKNLERFQRNKFFLGIRQGQLGAGLEKPGFVSNLKLLADAGLSLDFYDARAGVEVPGVLVRLLDKVPSLRLIVDHLPNLKYVQLPESRAGHDAYVAGLRELCKRPQVYMKLSEVVRRVDDSVSTDLSIYREWLDDLWDAFGEDRVLFGSDWPASEQVEFDSYPKVMTVARTYVAQKGPKAVEKVFWRNSVPAYRWIKRDSTQPQL